MNERPLFVPCAGLMFTEMHSGKSSSVRLRIRRWFGCVYDIVYFMPLLICKWSSPRTRAGDRSSRFDGWDGDGPLGLGCWDWQKMKHKWKSALNNKCSRAGLLLDYLHLWCFVDGKCRMSQVFSVVMGAIQGYY